MGQAQWAELVVSTLYITIKKESQNQKREHVLHIYINLFTISTSRGWFVKDLKGAKFN